MSLLTLDDIAARVSKSREYVRDRLVKRGDFPRPTLVVSQKIRRWASVDLECWLEKQRKKQAR
jgi:predicted DNA-binding transcriptional regulator AlpA